MREKGLIHMLTTTYVLSDSALAVRTGSQSCQAIYS